MLDINWRPDARQLRWFAALQILFCLAMSWAWRDALGAWGRTMLLSVSIAWGATGLLAPAFIRPLYVAWMGVVSPIGWIVSHAALAAAYYGVLTPIAAFARRRRGDPLQRDWDKGASSYWTAREGPTPVERYFRQF